MGWKFEIAFFRFEQFLWAAEAEQVGMTQPRVHLEAYEMISAARSDIRGKSSDYLLLVGHLHCIYLAPNLLSYPFRNVHL